MVMDDGNTIQYVPHSDIDKQRWDTCIQQAGNSLLYAKSAYLDAMSPGWDALIAGDYHYVMPLTWRRKLGIRYLFQPAFTQQLGVFGPGILTNQIVEPFLLKASLHFRLVEICLNYANGTGISSQAFTNLVLPLTDDYTSISSHYKKDLQKNLDRSAKFGLQYMASTNVALALQHYQETYAGRIGFRPSDYDHFTLLSKSLLASGNALIREARLPNGELLAVALLLKDEYRLYNLASTTLPNGRTLEANHFLFDQLIREFAGSGLLLDFEGSEQPGIRRFYEKFGPSNQPFYFWKSNRLPAVMRWWKR